MLARALKICRFSELDRTRTKPPRQPLISRAVEGWAYGRAGAKWQRGTAADILSTDLQSPPQASRNGTKINKKINMSRALGVSFACLRQAVLRGVLAAAVIGAMSSSCQWRRGGPVWVLGRRRRGHGRQGSPATALPSRLPTGRVSSAGGGWVGGIICDDRPDLAGGADLIRPDATRRPWLTGRFVA
jgi:hypothetical protein